MEITQEMLTAIPPGNVRVSVAEFAAFWQLAETECLRLALATPIGQTSWKLSYASAAMGTARWLAAAAVDLGPDHAPLTPASGIALGRANEQTIREAFDEAGKQLLLSPAGYKTAGMPARPGYLEGVRATLDWVQGYGPAPELSGQRSEPTPSQ